MYNIVKGTKVSISRMVQTPGACLSGSQIKFAAEMQNFEGEVRHIRGNHPINPTSIKVWVAPTSGDFTKDSTGTEWCEKCECLEIGEIDPDSIKSIIEDKPLGE